jgi:hypothetical protein
MVHTSGEEKHPDIDFGDRVSVCRLVGGVSDHLQPFSHRAFCGHYAGFLIVILSAHPLGAEAGEDKSEVLRWHAGERVERVSFVLCGQERCFALALRKAIPAGELQGHLHKIQPEQRSGGRIRKVKDADVEKHFLDAGQKKR